jgi:hypothetical protein
MSASDLVGCSDVSGYGSEQRLNEQSDPIAHESSNEARISQRDLTIKKPQDSQDPAAFIW